ncbi:MAG TPA: hypothetical protein VKR24_12105 [Candidatus Limnocylindrales bacterium]|nr:hypothetical protein [Candidatus Limnocylindrales bacterium]
MTRKKTEAAVASAPESAVLDHFTPGEAGLYSHEEARARAAAYVAGSDDVGVADAPQDLTDGDVAHTESPA